jgi:hypothetical protein
MFRAKRLNRMPEALPDDALCSLADVRSGARTNFRCATSAPSPGRGLAKSRSMPFERTRCLHGHASGRD